MRLGAIPTYFFLLLVISFIQISDSFGIQTATASIMVPAHSDSACEHENRVLLPDSNAANVLLPCGLDPIDVVETVQRNRAGADLWETPARGGATLSTEAESSTAGRFAPVGGVGQPFLIGSGDAVYGSAANEQRFAAVAFDGTNYLVVWQDKRSGTFSDIYGARVNANGIVLDTAGIAISTGPVDQLNPAIAFDGTNYLVVWQDNRSRSSWDIYGARVTVSGIVLDPEGFAIATGEINQYSPATAFDGTNFLVVWMDYDYAPGYDIRAARVSTSGSVLDPVAIGISTATKDQCYPSIAFDGSNYVVVWDDTRSGTNYDIYGARVSTGGVVLDAGGIAISVAVNDQRHPSIAFDVSNCLVVWEDNRTGSYDIYGARLGPDGVVLDTSGIAISSAVYNQFSPSVAFDGTNYLVVWHDLRTHTSWDIYGARVSMGGTVLDATGILISAATGYQFNPALAFGSNFLVVWDDSRGSATYDIYGGRVSMGGSVIDTTGIRISTAANNQYNPAVAFGGSNYLVVWENYRNGSYDIYGARVTPEGSVLDPAGIGISTGVRNERWPAIASDGTNYFVLWTDSRNVTDYDIYGARISSNGSVLDPAGIAISTTESFEVSPAIAFDGENFLVVWYDDYSYDIRGARVSTSGSVLDPDGIPISVAVETQELPAIASDGANFLVVWQDWRNMTESYPYSDIYGARVSADGNVLDTAGIAIATGTSNQRNPAIAFNGTDYLVVWENYVSGSASGYDIYGARVLPYGTVLNPASPISAGPNDQLSPALACGASSGLMITYLSFMPPPIYGSYRTWGSTENGPIGIAFVSASGIAEQGHVSLSWQMAVEAVTSSFRIERSESPGGGFVTLDVPIDMSPGLRFSCTDYSTRPGRTYWYVIVLAGPSSGESYGPIEVRLDAAPTAYRAYQSYPNPFNPVCTIRYDIPRAGKVSLDVFDVGGSPVRTLVSAWREPGVYSEVWDGKGNDGSVLPSGVYFYSLRADEFVATHKTVLLK